MMSYWYLADVDCNHDFVSEWIILFGPAFKRLNCALIWLQTFEERSKNVHSEAPLESASMPRMPLPAKRSKQRASLIVGDSQLKRVSRIRFGVGRTPSSCKNLIFRPRHWPAIIFSWDACGDFEVDLWGILVELKRLVEFNRWESFNSTILSVGRSKAF